MLDADDDLAQELDIRMRLGAGRVATAKVLDAKPGECDLAPWLDAVGHGPGLLLLEGLMAVQTRVADRTVTELLGAGDLVQPLFQSVDDMLERLRTGQTAVLRDVPDEERRHILPLRHEEQLRRRFADLADAARGRLELQ